MYYNGEYPDLVNVNEITYILEEKTIAYQIMIRYLKCSDFRPCSVFGGGPFCGRRLFKRSFFDEK